MNSYDSQRRLIAGLASVAVGAAAGALGWLLLGTVGSTWTALHRPAPSSDDAIALLAALAGLAVCGWFALGLLLTAATAASEGSSRLARAARAVTPGVLARLVAVAVGATLATAATGATGATGASAAQPAASVTASTPAPDNGVDLSWGAAQGSHKGQASDPSGAVLVRPGDTLWGLAAARLDPAAGDAAIAAAWPGWFAANRRVIGDDPDLIVPGQRLRPPAEPTR